MSDKQAATIIKLPEGRLINHALFTRDQFRDTAEAYYRVELAFDQDILNGFHNSCLDAAVATWGDGADEDPELVVPIQEGDKLASKREANGKPGDAYKGKEVLRAKTLYNRHGEKGPGGIQVFGPDKAEIGLVNQSEVYQGCFGYAGVTIDTYVTNDGKHAITVYLSAFQKTRDGDRLVSAKDHSQLFEPVGRAPAAGGEESLGVVMPAVRNIRKG
jgi:hypothetical protein